MRRKISIVLFIVSVVLIIVGLRFGEYWKVLEQAITVCLSCIGIG